MKKLISLALVCVTLFTMTFCSPMSAFASGEKVTLISTKYGTLYNGEVLSYKFSLPTDSEVTIKFTGLDDDYEYGTYGSFYIGILDTVNDTYVYDDGYSVYYDDKNISMILPKGDYKFYLAQDGDYSFDYYFKVTATYLDEIEYTAISLDKKKATLAVGGSVTLTEKHEPSSAKTKPTWTSSKTKVATVDKNGKVTAKAMGTAKIKATLGNQSATCTVNVTSSGSYFNIVAGKKTSIKDKFKNISGYGSAKYSSDNKKIATVNSAGEVKGKTTGKVKITATINGVKYTQKINVKNPSLKLNKKSAKIYKGDISAVKGSSVKLKATTFPAKQKVTWKSSNTRVAKVSKSGKVTAVAPGTAKIKATFKFGGKTLTKTCKVTVKSKKAVTAKVSSIYDDDIYNDCYVTITNNTNKKITYITLDIKQYDNRGYRLSSPYEYYYVNESIKANSKETYYFWVNDNTKKAKVKVTKVWFSDGSTYTPKK